MMSSNIIELAFWQNFHIAPMQTREDALLLSGLPLRMAGKIPPVQTVALRKRNKAAALGWERSGCDRLPHSGRSPCNSTIGATR